jgi:fumarylacetoacetate (FAA) hydrolase
MKLASLKQGGRDGTLVVVSRDLLRAVAVPELAATLQIALDNWHELAAHLKRVYEKLNAGEIADALAFHPQEAASPLPRAYQWADGSAYVNHVELVRKARGAEMPPSFWTDPLMYQGGSDSFIGPCDPILAESESWDIDLEAEVAVITDDVPIGVSAQAATKHIRLLMLANDVSLRNLIAAELGKGFGFFQSKPATAFSPVAVTPAELGRAWDGHKLHLPLTVQVNGERLGLLDAGMDMTFDFPALVAHAARTRELEAGSIIGSGTVSNVDRSKGSACLAEKRMLETILEGKPRTPFLRFGDRVRIEMTDAHGHSVFGAIEQVVEKYTPLADN